MESYPMVSGNAQNHLAYADQKTVDKPHTLQMRDALGEAHSLASEAHSIIVGLTDRLFGGPPPTNGSGANTSQLQAIPNGAAEEMAHSARGLVNSLGLLRAAAARLESRL